jgi:hypothetical protein
MLNPTTEPPVRTSGETRSHTVLRGWRRVAAPVVVAGFAFGGVAILLDDSKSLVWSRADYSFVSLHLGATVLFAACVGGLAVGSALRMAAGLTLAVATLVVVLWPWSFVLRFYLSVRPLQELPLPDGRILGGYEVLTPAFARDFVAVRVERRCFGLWCIHYLTRGPEGSVALTLLDARHVRVHFVPTNERDAVPDRVVAIPP